MGDEVCSSCDGLVTTTKTLFLHQDGDAFPLHVEMRELLAESIEPLPFVRGVGDLYPVELRKLHIIVIIPLFPQKRQYVAAVVGRSYSSCTAAPAAAAAERPLLLPSFEQEALLLSNW